MKVQIVYASISGCTQKLAYAIYNSIKADEKSIHNLKDGEPELDGDIILLGYWGISGGPCDEVKKYLKSIKNKVVGVFCTLGYYADSAHAFDTVKYSVDLLKENNEIIGSFVCNGAISAELKGDVPSIPAEQKHIRWEITDNHPTQNECNLAAERFNERIYLYKRCKDLNIPFTSII